MELVFELLIGTVASLAAAEIYCSLPTIARWLTRQSIERLPSPLGLRYGEEWLAYLNDWDGNIGKFIAALGFVKTTSTFLAEWRTGFQGKQAHALIFIISHSTALTVLMKPHFILAKFTPLRWLVLLLSHIMSYFMTDSPEMQEQMISRTREMLDTPLGKSRTERNWARIERITAIARAVRNQTS